MISSEPKDADADAERASDRRGHWEGVFEAKDAREVSWFQETPRTSLELIRACGAGPEARIVDVGGGASTLVDRLLEAGHRNVTVLDIARSGLDQARRRLGEKALGVRWIVADVTRWRPGETFDLWHDRAVFHFLVDAADRAAYRRALEAAVASGGHVVIAAFDLEGPERCSGLPTARYDAAGLARELGEAFVLEDSRTEDHATPAGKTQRFRYCRFRRA